MSLLRSSGRAARSVSSITEGIDKQLFQTLLFTARSQTSEARPSGLHTANSCCQYVRWLHNRSSRTFAASAAVNQHSHSTGSTSSVEAAKRKTGWAAVPAVPKVLGLGGLIPFFALSPPLMQAGGELLKSLGGCESVGAFILTDVLPSAAMMQIGYGTSIVSFLGAVHWGAAMQSRTGHTTKIMFERYVWSVVPALVVAPAASAGPETGSMLLLTALLLTHCIDAKFNWKGALPKWYMALRVPLTVGAVAAVAVTLFMHKESALEDHTHHHAENLRDGVTDAVVLR